MKRLGPFRISGARCQTSRGRCDWLVKCHECDVFHKNSPSLWNAQSASRSDTIRERELARIRADLRNFFTVSEARLIVGKIEEISIEIDSDIAAILGDPRSSALYRYDGRIFTSRHERLFHAAFDGLRLLEWLSATVFKALFSSSGRTRELERLFEKIEKIRWVATTRRRNWEEFGTLGLVPGDPLPLSAEEARFFRSLGI